MMDNKGGQRRQHLGMAALLALPPLCLLAFCLELPFPVPRFIVPSADYALSPRSSAAEALAAAAGGRFGVVRLVKDGPPSKADAAAARAHYEATGMPVRFVRPGAAAGGGVAADAGAGPLLAYSLVVRPGDAASPLSLLLDEEAAGEAVSVALGGRPAASVDAGALGADRRLSLAAAASADGSPVTVELASGRRKAAFRVLADGGEAPRILFASARTGSRSIVEALYPVRRVSLDELGTAGMYDYELVVVDGAELPSLGTAVVARLVEYVGRGAGSLLVVVDSPRFGKTGDSPALEAILPVTLSPLSLSRLPDVAMAVALDASGSMYGDKLSLAKSTCLELVANLKPSDELGILLFDEDYNWLYPMSRAGSMDAEAVLAPLRAGGGTRLYPALEAAITAAEASSLGEKRVIVVSDGISAPAPFDALVSRALREGIAISTMAVGAEIDRPLLTRIAAGSGGRFYRVSDAADVPSLIIEDRMSASRVNFAEGRTTIVDVAGAKAGWVDGMARLSPKDGALVFFGSESGEPLLSSMRSGRRSVLVYASDLYGRYGSDFFADARNVAVLKSILDGLLTEGEPEATVTETREGLSVCVRGDYLVEPRILLADASGAVAAEAAMEALGAGAFSALVSPEEEGRYTALVMDRGSVAARWGVYANDPSDRDGILAWTTESAAAAADYRVPFWALLPGRTAWLVAFFALSLAATLVLRYRL